MFILRKNFLFIIYLSLISAQLSGSVLESQESNYSGDSDDASIGVAKPTLGFCGVWAHLAQVRQGGDAKLSVIALKRSALSKSCMYGSHSMFAILLEEIRSLGILREVLSHVDEADGSIVLHDIAASRHYDQKIACSLLKEYRSQETLDQALLTGDSYDETALHIAFNRNNVEFIEEVIEFIMNNYSSSESPVILTNMLIAKNRYGDLALSPLFLASILECYGKDLPTVQRIRIAKVQ